MKTKILVLLIALFSINGFSQNVYYAVNGNRITNEEGLIEIQENLESNGKFETLHLKTIHKNDSIIHYVKLHEVPLTQEGVDIWGETRKLMTGKRFPIEDFKDEHNQNFSDDFLTSKPSFINFWFTQCYPCIEEMPSLNRFEEKYRDQVNFISVTFNSQSEVQSFLEKFEFNFMHITDARTQIDEFKLGGYPTTFILDKNGIIKVVHPFIDDFDIKDIETTLETLIN